MSGCGILPGTLVVSGAGEPRARRSTQSAAACPRLCRASSVVGLRWIMDIPTCRAGSPSPRRNAWNPSRARRGAHGAIVECRLRGRRPAITSRRGRWTFSDSGSHPRPPADAATARAWSLLGAARRAGSPPGSAPGSAGLATHHPAASSVRPRPLRNARAADFRHRPFSHSTQRSRAAGPPPHGLPLLAVRPLRVRAPAADPRRPPAPVASLGGAPARARKIASLTRS